MSSKLEKKFDFWVQHNMNVLLVGEHGIGKTEMVKAAFERNNLKWRYFSAATMDPWVDFVGVPKEKVGENGESYLDLIRPLEFQDGSVEILFFDEFNRAPGKVRNAVMELLQFKSVNGRKFPNLRAVWAAINPYDEEETYDVDRLDPAQEDRFHVKFQLPSTPCKQYFRDKYGTTLGERAVEWWNRLPDECKKITSPRRLDYCMDYYTKGGDVTDVLDKQTRPTVLVKHLERIDSEKSTHEEKWLEDSELYIQDISERNSKIDTVEAFQALGRISQDQAVSYVDRLPARQLKELVNAKTVHLLLACLLADSEKTRQIKTALKSYTMSEEVASDYLHQSMKTATPTILEQTKNISNRQKNWNELKASVKKLASKETLKYADCIIILLCCTEKLRHRKSLHKTSSKMQYSIMEMIVIMCEYVEHQYPSYLHDFISIDPNTIANVYIGW